MRSILTESLLNTMKSSLCLLTYLATSVVAGAQCAQLGVVDDGTGGSGAVGLPALVLSEIIPGDYIELFNTTGAPIVLTNTTYQLCSPFTYASLASLGPAVTVPASGYATVPSTNSKHLRVTL